METESTSHRLSTMFVVAIMLLAPMLILVTISPVASAAVTTGATVDMIPASSRYIRDDSTAVPIWGFGATSSTGLDRLWEVNVWFDMTGTGLTTGDIEGLSTAGSSSGVGLYRDTGGTDDAFDSTDLPITVTSIQWFWSFGDYYCRMRLNGILEWVPTAAALQGSYQWFIVVRTDSNIEASDLVRTWLNAGDIDYTDGSSQPSSGVTGSTLDVRASSYDFVGSGGISTSDAEAALGIRICDGGPYDTFDYIRIQFQNGGGFTQTDLATLGLNPATSGVALYRNDGTSSSSWDASDTGLTLSSMSISWPFVYLYPNSEALPDRPRSGYDYWIVVRTSATISDGNTFTVIGDTSTIIVDGLSAGADQNTATPESGYDDYGTFVCDNVAPGISSMVWTEWSSYLHPIGSTLYFSNLMTWTQTATLRCNAWDSSSGIW